MCVSLSRAVDGIWCRASEIAFETRACCCATSGEGRLSVLLLSQMQLHGEATPRPDDNTSILNVHS